jgi:hypothetical protein
VTPKRAAALKKLIAENNPRRAALIRKKVYRTATEAELLELHDLQRIVGDAARELCPLPTPVEFEAALKAMLKGIDDGATTKTEDLAGD